jgi:hypothetical protein
MLTFHPSARQNADGEFMAVVMQRGDKGRMQGCARSSFTFDTREEALAFAVASARRVSARMPFTRVSI